MTTDLEETVRQFRGGIVEIKNGVQRCVDDQKRQERQIQSLFDDVEHFKRARLSGYGVKPAPGQVSDTFARWLAGLSIVAAARRGDLHPKDAHEDNLVRGLADELGMSLKTAETATQLPQPTQYSAQISELVATYGSARKYGTVFPMSAGTMKLPYLSTDTAFALVGLSSGGGEKQPAFAFADLVAEKYGGIVRVPYELDADSIVPVGNFLARWAARQMAAIEDKLFWTGNGTTDGDPEGLTISTITNSKVTQMASTKTHYSDLTLTHLRDVRGVVDAAVLQRGAYYMHPSFECALANLNTANVFPYQARGLDNNATLDGFPIRWIPSMPAYSSSVNASKVCVLFGDATYQYLGVRGNIRFDVSDQPYWSSDEIGFRALERFSIALLATGAVAGIETAAS